MCLVKRMGERTQKILWLCDGVTFRVFALALLSINDGAKWNE